MPEVLMPRLDPGMQSGKIVEWLKKEGERVEKGEPILVVEGEKTTFEVEAPESGTLTKILASIGTDVDVSHPVAIIGEASGQPRNHAPVDSQPKSEPPPQIEHKPTPQHDCVVASPAARRLAQEHGVDLTKLTGTGPGGRVSREDVLAAVQTTTAAASTVAKFRQPTILARIKLEGIRKTVAERLGFSARTGVPVTLTMEADASKLVNLKNREDHVSFTALVVKAVARALEAHISINSSIEGDEVTTYSDINVAVAVNTDHGLVAPVIQNAIKKSAREINTEIDALSQKAKENRLTVEEVTGGTFTVTNLGAYDVESFAPVINPPQCAILGLGQVA